MGGKELEKKSVWWKKSVCQCRCLGAMGPEEQLRQEPPETLHSLCMGMVGLQLDKSLPASSETCYQLDGEGVALP